jgi:hypothetical protein
MAPRPEILYKYLDQSGAKAFLEKPQLRFADWRQLDDLMEVLPGNRKMTESEIQQQALIKARQIGYKVPVEKCAVFYREMSKLDPTFWENGMRELLMEQPATLFVCSMTERFDSGSMWGLYAERHQGIVCGFSAVIDKICVSRANLAKVTYAQERPQMPLPAVDPSILRKAVRTKSTDWAHQQEWRLISDNGTDEFLSPCDVSEIIVGYKSPVEIEGMAKSFKASGARVFRGYPHPQLHQVARKEI